LGWTGDIVRRDFNAAIRLAHGEDDLANVRALLQVSEALLD
jgi:hypothetical protein